MPHLERPAPPAYPAWLTEAWKKRDAWRGGERHRDAPWLFRQAESAIEHAERSWEYGSDADAGKKELNGELDRVDKYMLRLAKATRPEPLSIAVDFPKPSAWASNVKELFRKVVEVRAGAAKPEDADKAAFKVIEEFLEKHKAVTDGEWASG